MAAEPTAEGLQRRPYPLGSRRSKRRAIEGAEAHARWHPFATSPANTAWEQPGRAQSSSAKTHEIKDRCVEDGESQTDQLGHRARLDRLQSHGPRLAHRLRARAREGSTVVRADSAFRPKNAVIRLTAPIVRRKLHQTQQAIVVGLKGLRRDGRGAQSGPAERPSRRRLLERAPNRMDGRRLSMRRKTLAPHGLLVGAKEAPHLVAVECEAGGAEPAGVGAERGRTRAHAGVELDCAVAAAEGRERAAKISGGEDREPRCLAGARNRTLDTVLIFMDDTSNG